MTVLGCKWHPSQDNIGICAHCLRESLSKLAVYQEEDDDSTDLENFAPGMPMGVPAGSRRAQFILVQYNDGGSRGGLPGDNSDLFYPGVNRNAMGALVGGNQYTPGDKPTDLHLDGAYHVDMQGEGGTADDSGSGGHDEPMAQHAMPTALDAGESGRHKRKLHGSASGRRKPKGWGAAMMKMIGFRTSGATWRSEKKADATSSGTKRNELALEDSDQQYTPPRFSVSSGLEQSTPARYSVSSPWEQQTASARYPAAPGPEQVTPARYSGASLFDIDESMDSRRFSTSSRGSPFAGKKHAITGDAFHAPWRASKAAATARKMGAHEGFGRDESFASGKASQSAGMRSYGDDGAGQCAAKSPKKSPWKWFSSFRGVTPREDRRDWMSSQKNGAGEAPAADPGFQERRRSTSSMYAPKSRDSPKLLTPVLTSKKSPWWRASSPRPRTPRAQKSPLMVPAKAGNGNHLDQEVATDSDLMDDTPHRRSSASPMVGYSRSSSNGSSCFTTPRWNNRQRPQHSGTRGMAGHEKEHEITHLAI